VNDGFDRVAQATQYLRRQAVSRIAQIGLDDLQPAAVRDASDGPHDSRVSRDIFLAARHGDH
jgi:hypothetical protein